jgi:hypothetical protein
MNVFTWGYNNDSIELKLKTATWSLWVPLVSEAKIRKEVPALPEIISADYLDGAGISLHSRNKEYLE